MAYWLLKSEPNKYPWDKLVADGRTHWDGVRNHQAAIHLKTMRPGDKAFFYHSNEGLEIVGIAEIAKAAYPDPSDPTGRFVMVDIKPVRSLVKPVTLKTIKATATLKEMALVKLSRLSVGPVSDDEWKIICAMGETAP